MDSVVDRPKAGSEDDPLGKTDVMNDAVYDPKGNDDQNSLEEPDTCRICRGEGSQEEPLFYPCKCSGSIKFVHQNCLIEWLSHSQKKHCELCKTPFHFTKLYSPNMPNTVPLPIFLRQAAVHMWKSMVTTSRFLLVTFVWAAWLPWCMRTIWRGLFWIGDGAWVNWKDLRLLNESTAYGLSSRHVMGGMTSLDTDSLTAKEATASAVVAQISSKLPRFIPPAGKLFSFSSGRPWSFVLLRKTYSYLTTGTSGSVLSPSSTPVNATRYPGPVPRSSWLSEFQFMRNLTPSTMINNMLIDALEGQLITLFVVTAFILIFLIREWVVQQQPILNGGNNLRAEVAVAQEAPAPQPPAEQRPRVPEGGANEDPIGEGLQGQGPRARMIARARPRRHLRRLSEQGGGNLENTSANAARNGLGETEELPGSTQPSRSENEPSSSVVLNLSSLQPQRPPMPDRDSLANAAEIRRAIDEHARAYGAQDSDVEIFMDLWSRAGRDPVEVTKIIEQEGRNDDLRWVVAAMAQIDRLVQEPQHEQGHKNTQSEGIGPDDSIEKQATAEGDSTLDRLPSSRRDFDARAVLNGVASEGFAADELFRPHSSPAIDALETGLAETPSKERSQHLSLSNGQEDSANGEVHLDVDPEAVEEQTADQASVNANPALDNPFHPEYEGEFPEDSHNADVDVSDEEIASAQETILQINNLSGPANGQIQIPAVAEATGPARRIFEVTTDWLWGGVAPLPAPQEQPAGDDEQIVNDVADEAPFVPVDHGQPLPLAANDAAVANQDPDVVEAAVQAGVNPNEAEAAEEIEDLEGILELIGMQGPLAGLVQNGMFCACLVSLTILFGVWVPYISGKLFLVLLAHPVSLLFRIPLRWATSSADMIIDLFTFFAGCAFYWTDSFVSILCAPIGRLIPAFARLSQNTILADTAKGYAEGALERLANNVMATGGWLSESDIPLFSVIAHESLRSIETRLTWAIQNSCDLIAAISNIASQSSGLAEFSKMIVVSLLGQAKVFGKLAAENISIVLSSWPALQQVNPLRIKLSLPKRTIPLDYSLAYWNIKDRALAILFGYLFFALIGMAYLRISSRMQSGNRNGRVAGGVADGLYQAGGVMKVILIISIEMIVFPLYCGMLLDVALLPLFNNVTIISRINFTLAYPNTSLFVHWFVGTCYMFHFALFVSMCRKILRPGVLYFIRDPDDPTFHPVRDVLERSVSTQLWKISFSALVYGGLVIVCLGGVVWGIAYAFHGVFPIHWASNEPILEFPVDLLFYNFLMPLAVKFFRPSKGLNKMFSWWFRRCARALRLTNFLFGEKSEDEEGTHVQRKLAEEVNREEEVTEEIQTENSQLTPTSDKIVEDQFHRNGRHVRAPGTDQVRIPRGAHTFLEVDAENHRLDGQPDSDEGLHGRENAMFTKVYIPPMFRSRISAFIFLIWVFAAATGISMTIVPLLFGRFIFALVTPNHLRLNDIYAFSVGIYVLGGALYGILQRQRIVDYVSTTLTPHTTTIASFLRKSATVTLRILGFLYVYAAFSILLPALFSILMEFYFIIPVHTYFSTTFASLEVIQSERHIIHLIQDWTLGVLYLKMTARLILWNTPSRPATALRAIVRDGWLNPDVRLATRGFILPATLTIGIALVVPLTLGWIANATILHSFSSKDELFRACVYRYTYPGILAFVLLVTSLWALGKAFVGWRKKVRDEVYLIGERLHNFGEIKRRKGAAGRGKGKGRMESVAVGPA